MRLIKKENWYGCTIYNVIAETCIGSVEIIEEEKFIENIHFMPEYRGKGYLTDLIKLLKKKYKHLYCLPLKEHVKKFEHLGFTCYKENGEDRYYQI